MRNVLLSTALVLGTSLFLPRQASAQVPQAFDFQGVARDASGNVLSTQSLTVRLSVHGGSANGPVAYSEQHAVTTNAFGLFSVAVGQGSMLQGTFSTVAWSSAPHFLHVEMDAGNGFLDMGTTQLLSVPYALHAGGVDCAGVSMLGDTLKQANGCYVIIPGLSAANGGCLDIDQDGFYDRSGCNTPIDCNDLIAAISPNNQEVCGNGIDEDCSGIADDTNDPSLWVNWHPDGDGDGFGSNSITVAACVAPPGHLANGGDCDDNDPAIFPGQNCSGVCNLAEIAWLNENFTGYQQMVLDAYGQCFFSSEPEECMQSILENAEFPVSVTCNSCAFDWVECLSANCLTDCLISPENCMSCATSSGCTATMLQCFGLVDADGDGSPAGSDCDDNNAQIRPNAIELCDGIDNDCDGQVDEGNACCPDADADGFTTCEGDCDDENENNNPGAGEVCDGIDNDCNGAVDDGVLNFLDADGDGFGDPTQPLDCNTPGVPNELDCDDSNLNINPEAVEVCDGQDNNCDGQIDEDNVCCTDNDADGFTTCDGDCDDNNLNNNPDAVEVCDGLENNCDGQIDESCPELGQPCDGTDSDECGNGVIVCDGQGGCVCNETGPGNVEVCNEVDDDCDGSVDEGGVCPE